MSQTVLQQGSVGDLPLIDLLLVARGNRAPTIVELTRGNTQRRFYFRDGEFVAFTTSNPKESFPAFLVRKKKLQKAVAASVSQVAKTDGMTPAQVLLRDRLLPTPDIAAELGAWASVLLVQSFSWTDGTFRVLVEGLATTPPETLMEVTLPVVLSRGVWGKMSEEEVRRYVGSYLDFAASRVERPPFDLQDFRLTPQQLRLLEMLEKKPTVREAMASAALDEGDALRLVFLLQRSGMVELAPAEAGGLPDVDEWLDDDLGGFGDFDEEDEVRTETQFPAFGAQSEPAAPAYPTWSEPSVSPVSRPPSAPPPPDPATIPAYPARSSGEPSRPSSPAAPPAAPQDDGPPSHPRSASAGGSTLGVDLSSIGFRGGQGTRTSSTMHVGGGTKESLAGRPRPSGGNVAPPGQRRSGLAGLFGDAPDEAAAPRSGGGRPVAPPRGGRRGGGRVVPPRGAEPVAGPTSPPAAPTVNTHGPPQGPGPDISEEEWRDLPTKEKERVRGLRQMLIDFEGQNYFEYFELTPEATTPMVKKAYFKLARRFHPDSLIDESPIYARLAEAIFAKASGAYEVLEDDEAREKYVAKYIRGEKDENDLAMEKVQEILAAEAAFKAGVRLANQGKAVKAVEKLTEAVQRYDEEAEYRGWLGFALFRANQSVDFEKALEGERMLKEAIAEKPHVAELPHLMAKIAITRKDWSTARMWLRKSLKINADNPEAVRAYKRVDEQLKGGGPKTEEDSKLAKLFGRFGKK